MRTAQTEKICLDRYRIMRHLAGWLFGCAVLLLAALPVYAEEYKVTPVSGSGTIATETLNVRSGPGKEYDAIELVKSGEVVTITGQAENGWYQIELDGKTGYVSDKYVELKGDLTAADEAVGEDESGDDAQAEEEIGEPEEGWAFYQNPRFIKVAIIVAIIFVVFVMLVTTFRGIRGDRDPDDDYEGYGDADFDGDLEEDDDEYDNDEDDADDDDDEYDEDDDPGEARTVVIREEDYQLHIDPKYFENTTQIEQPDMVTGYLERQKLEAELEAANAEGRQKELEQAMRKLNELQAEIERLKKNQ